MQQQSNYIRKVLYRKIITATILVSLLQCVNFCASGQLRHVYIDANEDNDLRKISFYDRSHGYVAFRDWIGYTADSGRTFVRKYITLSNVNFNGYTVNVTFGFGIKGVKAFNQDTIIAYGDYGLVPSILYSIDGGNNFKLVFHSQFNPNALRTGITDMVFPQNNATGFAVDADRILKTTDKGLTWVTNKTEQARYFNFLEAVDNNIVFAISETRVWRTTNGGVSSNWTILPLPAAGTINYTQFITASKGWINIETADGGVLYYTSNGGSAWSAKTDLSIEPFSCIKMKFRNDSVGFAVVEDYYYTYKTSDSGRVWERIPRDNNFSFLAYNHEDIHFQTDSQFWVGGDYGLLELTTNAGGTTLPSARFRIDTTNVYSTNTVNLLNYSKPGYQYKWYLNNSLIASTYNASYTHDIYQAHDTITLIITNSIYSDTTIKIQDFNAVPYPPPMVSSYTPGSGGTGTIVLITGNFFVNVTSVSFGDIPASSFVVNSINQITAIVGAGANGNVAVTTPRGTGFLPGFITYPPPIINSFFPLSGPPGTIVTITGLNFNSTGTDNIVYFGSVRAAVLTATANQLTVSAPVGATYNPITVTINNHTAYSTLRFTITFPSTCGFTEFTFAPRKSFGTGSGFMAISDFDGDGKNDIAITSTYGMSVVRNTGSIGLVDFAPGIYYPSGTLPGDIAAGDLDGDGKPDIIVTNGNSNTVSFFKNTSINGAISFAPKIDIATNAGPAGITINDLDADGKPDVVIAFTGPNALSVSVYKNITINGAIAFKPKIDLATGLNASRVFAGDLDGDGKADLFTLESGQGTNFFSIYRNTSSIGNITFGPWQQFPYYTFAPQDGRLGDVDGDGKLDICTVYDVSHTPFQDNSIAFYRNTSSTGSISFSSAIPFASEGCEDATNLSLGDLDGDSKIDLLASCPFGGNIKLSKNYSSPGNINYASANAPYILINGGKTAIGDMDGDSRSDLIIAGAFSVYRNILNEHGAWAGKDTTICNGQAITLGRLPLTLSAADHIYSWTSNPAGFTSSICNPVVNPGVNTGYYLAVTDPLGCVHYDTISVNVGVAPSTVEAGPNKSICVGSTAQIGTPAVGSYTYSWTSVPAGYTSTIADPIVSPGVSTIYYLSVNSGTCIAKDTVTVIVNIYPVANAGPDKFVCPPNGTSIGSPGSGSNVYNWTSNPPGYVSSVPNPSVFPTVTTTYFLKVTLNGCSSYDTVLATVLPMPPIPVVTASGPLSFCAGGSVTLTSSVASNLQWYKGGSPIPGATNQDLVVTQSETYYAIITLGICHTQSTGTTVTVTTIPATPTVIAGGAVSFCEGGSVVLTSSANSGNQWYKDGVAINGAINKTFTATQAGSYTVKVTVNGCSSAVSNAIAVNVNPIPAAPTITAGGPVSFCAGGSVVLSSSPGSNYQWYRDGVGISGGANQTYTATQYGSYTAKVMINGCISPMSNAIVVSVGAVTPTITAGGPAALCSGGNVILTSSAALGNQWYKDGIAINGETNQTYSATQAGSYTVITTIGSCTSPVSNAIVVTVSSSVPTTPTITAGGPVTICDSSNVILTSSAASGNQWYRNGIAINGATVQTYSATQDGNYTVKVTIGGCTSLASNAIVVIVVSAGTTPSITAGGPVSFCDGGNVVLTSSSASGNQWYKNGIAISGSINQTYSATQAGSYTVKVTGSSCTSQASNSIVITVNSIPATPSVTAGGPISFCNGDSVVLTSAAASGNQWYKDGVPISGATGQNYTANQSGSFSVKVTVAGCASLASNAIAVTVNSIPATPVITQTGNNLVSSSASGNQWYLNGTSVAGATGTSYTPVVSGLYTVIATINGCASNVSASINYIITAVVSPTLDRAISITPNPTSDQVFIKYSGTIGKFSVSVSDMSGKIVFNAGSFTTTYSLSLKSYSSGPYIIKIVNTRTGESMYRVIIKM